MISICPRETRRKPLPSACLRIPAEESEHWIRPAWEWLSILDAVLTVSPNKQYRGFREPTTLATTGPEWLCVESEKKGVLSVLGDNEQKKKTMLPLLSVDDLQSYSKIEFAQVVVVFVDKGALRSFECVQGEVSYSLRMIRLVLGKICDAHPTVRIQARREQCGKMFVQWNCMIQTSNVTNLSPIVSTL